MEIHFFTQHGTQNKYAAPFSVYTQNIQNSNTEEDDEGKCRTKKKHRVPINATIRQIEFQRFQRERKKKVQKIQEGGGCGVLKFRRFVRP